MGVENNGGVRGGGGSRRANAAVGGPRGASDNLFSILVFLIIILKMDSVKYFFSLNLFLFNHLNPPVTNYEGVTR
jgi:hypothetical protein